MFFKRIFNNLRGRSDKNYLNSSEFQLLSAAEKLIDEVAYGSKTKLNQYHYLLYLYRIERLLDALRATQVQGFTREQMVSYRKREDEFRHKLYDLKVSMPDQQAVEAIIDLQTQSDQNESKALASQDYR